MVDASYARTLGFLPRRYTRDLTGMDVVEVSPPHGDAADFVR